jgi:hypothetical protein
MKRLTSSLLLFGLAIGGRTALAQVSAPANSLAGALATFAAADANHDGKISAQELSVLPIERREFEAHDYDKDGTWSRDEFLVFYRRRLLLAGQPIAADLEAETARVLALRQTRAAEQAKARAKPAPTAPIQPVAAPVAAVATAPSSSIAIIEAGLEEALTNLEHRAQAGHATRDDFQRVRDELVTRARAAANTKVDPADDVPIAYGSEAYRKMMQSLERLENRANSGVYSPEEYKEFRDMIIHRARQIAKKDAAVASTAASSEIATIESGLKNAIDALEQRAAAGHATREDFQIVRDQMIARARAAASSDNPADAGGAAGSDTYEKMMSALERLEKRAATGAYSREEYQELRQMFVHRARAIQEAKSAPQTSSADRAAPGSNASAAPAPVVQRAAADPVAQSTRPTDSGAPAQRAPADSASQPQRTGADPGAQPPPATRAPGTDSTDASKTQRPAPAADAHSRGTPAPDPQRPPH